MPIADIPMADVLFDHLVGVGEQQRRNFEAHRLGGLGVQSHLEFDR
jgi:hypothetical protein